MKALGFILAILLLLGGLGYATGFFDSVAEGQVESSLAEAGVPADIAECMAPRLVRKLSYSQLLKLRALRGEEGDEQARLSPSEILDRIQRVDDPEAIRVMTGTATACAVSSVFG